MSSSSWAQKLQTKISALSPTSSKESVLTLAKWIGFNRKHATAFVKVLADHLQQKESSNNQSILPVYISVIHQVLLLDKDNPTKWDKLADTRVLIGEMLVQCIQQHKLLDRKLAREKLSIFIKDWDSSNVFGGPTLVNHLKRELAGINGSTTGSSSTAAPAEVEQTQKLESTDRVEKKSEKKTGETLVGGKITGARSNASAGVIRVDTGQTESNGKDKEQAKENTVEPKATIRDENETALSESRSNSSPDKAADSTISNNNKTSTVVYDFESKGIRAASVEMKELHDPCKSVATLQIARDLRNDSAQQLAALLAELPAPVRKYMEQARQEQLGETAKVDISEDQARDLSIQTNETAINLNVQDELSNINMFREIVEKQKSARQLLILLLVKSRCQFGSNTAAEAFLNAQRAMGEISKRKQILQDAMELEGATFEGGETDDDELNEEDQEMQGKVSEKMDDELTLDWYQPGVQGEESPEKKARVE